MGRRKKQLKKAKKESKKLIKIRKSKECVKKQHQLESRKIKYDEYMSHKNQAICVYCGFHDNLTLVGIVKELRNVFPDVYFKEKRVDNGSIQLYFKSYSGVCCGVMLTVGVIYDDIERVIRKKLHSKHEKVYCDLCYKKSDFTSCNGCYRELCFECLLNSIKKHRGVMICPYCGDKRGKQQPDLVVNIIVKTMRKNFYLNKK